MFRKMTQLLLITTIIFAQCGLVFAEQKNEGNVQDKPEPPQQKRKTLEEVMKEAKEGSDPVKVRYVHGVTIIDLAHNLDDEYRDFQVRLAIHESLKNKHKFVLLNLGQVSKIDSYGLYELTTNWLLLNHEGGRLKLLNVTKSMKDLLMITEMLSIFDCYENEVEAIKSFK